MEFTTFDLRMIKIIIPVHVYEAHSCFKPIVVNILTCG